MTNESKTTPSEHSLIQALKNARDALRDVKGKMKIFNVEPWPWLLKEIENINVVLDTSENKEPKKTDKDIRHRCSSCLRDFSSHGSCIVHIGNYHSEGGSGEYDRTAYAIRKD